MSACSCQIVIEGRRFEVMVLTEAEAEQIRTQRVECLRDLCRIYRELPRAKQEQFRERMARIILEKRGRK